MDLSRNRLEIAIGVLALVGPRNLHRVLASPIADAPVLPDTEVRKLVDTLPHRDPNSAELVRFVSLLRSWDNAVEPAWDTNSDRNSGARRSKIYQLLEAGPAFDEAIDRLFPYFRLDEPVVIAKEHVEWYEPKEGFRDYYWQSYKKYLKEKKAWNEESVLVLDNASRAVVERLSNPEAAESFAARGLVMGYVQSGKTANFTAVIARAADAGYRLIIVLAGTWNILRNQTQRRFDKELLGKQLLANDVSYIEPPPPDWEEFLEHEVNPEDIGVFTWQRLTRPDIDFKRLKAAIDHLEFERADKGFPINNVKNLHSLPAKLLVIKKHPKILSYLVRDLKLLRTKLSDLPTLVIDDESDQAGINTLDPKKPPKDGKTRTETNRWIAALLALLPRGQYVGYTATPYANALVNVDDPEDLFPRDFIISLEKPKGYMGVSDFFDPTSDFQDLDESDFSIPEIAHVRRVGVPSGQDDESLSRALASYVLAGAVKLFRLASEPERFQPAWFKHHTMLVHTSSRTGEHTDTADRLESLWSRCAFKTPRGLKKLEEHWENDFRKIAIARRESGYPATFDALVPHLSKAIVNIERGGKFYVVLNSDSPSAPDFNASPVWKVIIGGNKLSRGYTVEGLTVSYYRRVAGAADTLMQMGRWFGFRPGYRDLVRVFLGVADGKKGDTDLVALFKDACRMEEAFRQEVRRYLKDASGRRITPREVPPLIAMIGALPPTSKNKMFNARITHKNFGGQWSMQTRTPAKKETILENVSQVSALLNASQDLGAVALGGVQANGMRVVSPTRLFAATTKNTVEFIEGFKWLESEYGKAERPQEIELQIEFLRTNTHKIDSWLICAPQRRTSFGPPVDCSSSISLHTKQRKRIEGRRFQVFGEPPHRLIASFLAGVESDDLDKRIVSPSPETARLLVPHRAVMLLYAVRENERSDPSFGFEILFPENQEPKAAQFVVRRNNDAVSVAAK
jgi:hypothetical protein